MITSVYIHIPFCDNICSYCDFCKIFYNEKLVDEYLMELEKEIDNNYRGEKMKTIYVGGGTPSSLNFTQLSKLLEITNKFHKNDNFEFTFECNFESMNEEKLKLLFANDVNRLSFGVQTFNNEMLKQLNRYHSKENVFEIINLAKSIGFKNISVDLIYALPNQTIEDLKKDLSEYLDLDINHISTYSLIIEPHTKFYINNTESASQELDNDMYRLITKTLENKGYNHYETSNFSKKGYQSLHNLTYWNNNRYYGFGLGAGGYVNNIRYNNTRSISNYLKGQHVYESETLTKNMEIENELLLGFRKTKGINKQDFFKKFKKEITTYYPIKNEIDKGNLINSKDFVFIPKDKIYIANNILVNLIGEDYE